MGRRIPILRITLCFALAVADSLAQDFFPKSIFDENVRVDQARRDWYSKELKALGEPSLWELSKVQTTETYRFLWLRSFNSSIAVRIDINGGWGVLITTKVASNSGGSPPDHFTENRTVNLSKQQATWFLDQVERVSFWNLPTTQPNNGRDGSQWILEGVKGGQYHVVDRWSPKEGAVRTLGLMAIDLAQLKLHPDEVY